MKNSIKVIIVSILLVCSTNVFAEGVDIITLTTTAEGKTKDEAVMNALRSAIEQAFGAFISSKTQIVNDQLIRDEIVSVASGNIQKYDVLSTTAMPNGHTVVSVKADVSVAKLTKFSESKGITVEFKGGLFAANIKLLDLYAKNELEAVKNLHTIVSEILSNQILYNYKITVSEPKAYGNQWEIEHTIKIIPNTNLNNLRDIINNTLRSLALSEAERNDYRAKNKDFFKVNLDADGHREERNTSAVYFLRNGSSVRVLNSMLRAIDFIKYRCQVKNGVYTKTLYSRVMKDKKGESEWRVGLLTGYIPTYSYTEFQECECGLFTEQFDIRSRSFDKRIFCNDYECNDNCKYGTYNESRYGNGVGNMCPLKPMYWDENSYYSSSLADFRFSFALGATVSYTDILPLSVLEKIQEFTVEPYNH
jgi:hypothetical protein